MNATILVIASLCAVGLALARLLIGPTHADRVVALDLVFSASVALAAAAALASGRVLFLDVAIGLSVVGFAGAIAWARLVDKLPPGER